MHNPSTHELMTTAQVARYLGVHPDTVRRYRKRGWLEAVPLPVTGKRPGLIRFRRSDVEALLEPAVPLFVYDKDEDEWSVTFTNADIPPAYGETRDEAEAMAQENLRVFAAHQRKNP